MSDTPVLSQPFPPPSKLDTIKGFIGDLARPFAIVAIASATAAAIVTPMITTDKLTAAGMILAVLFGAKTYEVATQSKQAAGVAVAQATGSAPTK